MKKPTMLNIVILAGAEAVGQKFFHDTFYTASEAYAAHLVETGKAVYAADYQPKEKQS